MVVSYVFDADGGISLLKKSDLLEVGVSGYGPTEWRLLQVAGKAYWGTLESALKTEGLSICHQGDCGKSWYLLGENHRGEIVVLLNALSESDDTGAVGLRDRKRVV